MTADRVTLTQEAGYRFAVRYSESQPPFHGDEGPPLGAGDGATPLQLLAAAVGNCLSSSLTFAYGKFRQSPGPLATTAQALVGRNEHNRLRVQEIRVRIRLGVPAASLEHTDRVLAQFEDFCTVTASVRQAIPVAIEIEDSAGLRLK